MCLERQSENGLLCEFVERGVKNTNDENNGCCIVIVVGNRIVS